MHVFFVFCEYAEIRANDFFSLKESAAENLWFLLEIYGDQMQSIFNCGYWFRCFERDNFDTEGKEHPGNQRC